MSATKLSMDWTSVAFTPSGGSAVNITNVVDVDFDSKGTSKPFYGDAARFAKAIAVVEMHRTAKVQSGDVAVLQGFAVGTVGSLTATLNDLKNAAASGAIVFTLANAVVTDVSGKGKVNDYGMGEISFEAYSSDGTTDPLTTAVTA